MQYECESFNGSTAVEKSLFFEFTHVKKRSLLLSYTESFEKTFNTH